MLSSNLKKTRRNLIKFLEDKGIKEIEGIALEECHTSLLIRVARAWGWRLTEDREVIEDDGYQD